MVIWFSTAKLIVPNCDKRNRNRYALELPSREQVKHPSLSVNPDNQESWNVGVTNVGLKSTT